MITGCDSSIQINLEILEVNTTVVDESPNLIAQAEDASFQWLNCDLDFEVMDGDTLALFSAEENGVYAVQVSQFGCVDTSECITVLNVAVDELNKELNAQLLS